jgi:hypothetical protein
VRRAVGLLGAAIWLACGMAAHADAPRSAIPWLSRSIRAQETTAGSLGAPPTLGTEPIGVETLSTPEDASAGILTPDVTGFDRDMWGPTAAAEATRMIAEAGAPALF